MSTSQQENCVACKHSGLPILFVYHSAVAKEHGGDPQFSPGTVAEAFTADIGLPPLKDANYVLRTLRPGAYLYIYHETPPRELVAQAAQANKTKKPSEIDPDEAHWEVFRVLPGGALVPSSHELFDSGAEFYCKRGDGSHVYTTVTYRLRDAHLASNVWAAVSANEWDAKLRRRNKANPEVMSAISIPQVLAGTAGKNMKFPDAAWLNAHVADFALQTINHGKTEASSRLAPLHATGQTLVDRMRLQSKGHPKTEGRGFVFALKDPVGTAHALADISFARYQRGLAYIEANQHPLGAATRISKIKQSIVEVQQGEVTEHRLKESDFIAANGKPLLGPEGLSHKPPAGDMDNWVRLSVLTFTSFHESRAMFKTLPATSRWLQLQGQPERGIVIAPFDDVVRHRAELASSKINRLHHKVAMKTFMDGFNSKLEYFIGLVSRHDDDRALVLQWKEMGKYFHHHFDPQDPNLPEAKRQPGIVYLKEAGCALVAAPTMSTCFADFGRKALNAKLTSMDGWALRTLVANQAGLFGELNNFLEHQLNWFGVDSNRLDKSFDVLKGLLGDSRIGGVIKPRFGWLNQTGIGLSFGLQAFLCGTAAYLAGQGMVPAMQQASAAVGRAANKSMDAVGTLNDAINDKAATASQNAAKKAGDLGRETEQKVTQAGQDAAKSTREAGKRVADKAESAGQKSSQAIAQAGLAAQESALKALEKAEKLLDSADAKLAACIQSWCHQYSLLLHGILFRKPPAMPKRVRMTVPAQYAYRLFLQMQKQGVKLNQTTREYLHELARKFDPNSSLARRPQGSKNITIGDVLELDFMSTDIDVTEARDTDELSKKSSHVRMKVGNEPVEIVTERSMREMYAKAHRYDALKYAAVDFLGASLPTAAQAVSRGAIGAARKVVKAGQGAAEPGGAMSRTTAGLGNAAESTGQGVGRVATGTADAAGDVIEGTTSTAGKAANSAGQRVGTEATDAAKGLKRGTDAVGTAGRAVSQSGVMGLEGRLSMAGFFLQWRMHTINEAKVELLRTRLANDPKLTADQKKAVEANLSLTQLFLYDNYAGMVGGSAEVVGLGLKNLYVASKTGGLSRTLLGGGGAGALTVAAWSGAASCFIISAQNFEKGMGKLEDGDDVFAFAYFGVGVSYFIAGAVWVAAGTEIAVVWIMSRKVVQTTLIRMAGILATRLLVGNLILLGLSLTGWGLVITVVAVIVEGTVAYYDRSPLETWVEASYFGIKPQYKAKHEDPRNAELESKAFEDAMKKTQAEAAAAEIEVNMPEQEQVAMAGGDWGDGSSVKPEGTW